MLLSWWTNAKRAYVHLHPLIYQRTQSTLDLNSSTCIGQIKLIFILMYFAQPNKNNNFQRLQIRTHDIAAFLLNSSVNIFQNSQCALTSTKWFTIHILWFVKICLFIYYKIWCQRWHRKEMTINATTRTEMCSLSEMKYSTTNNCRTTYTSIHWHSTKILSASYYISYLMSKLLKTKEQLFPFEMDNKNQNDDFLCHIDFPQQKLFI